MVVDADYLMFSCSGHKIFQISDYNDRKIDSLVHKPAISLLLIDQGCVFLRGCSHSSKTVVPLYRMHVSFTPESGFL